MYNRFVSCPFANIFHVYLFCYTFHKLGSLLDIRYLDVQAFSECFVYLVGSFAQELEKRLWCDIIYAQEFKYPVTKPPTIFNLLAFGLFHCFLCKVSDLHRHGVRFIALVDRMEDVLNYVVNKLKIL